MAAAGGMDPHSDAESVASAADSTAEWGTEYLVDDILRTRLPRQSVDVIHDSGTLVRPCVRECTDVCRAGRRPARTRVHAWMRVSRSKSVLLSDAGPRCSRTALL